MSSDTSKHPTLEIDRVAPTRRPAGRPIGYQVWTNLLFVHWRVPAEWLQPLIPRELTIDTWDGSAWIGLVPFEMSGVRPWWCPAVPGVSKFLETNVRTYVHFRGGAPGVWFFSLDASSSLAVRVARWRWHLPYHRAQMTLDRQGNSVSCSSTRLWPGQPGVGCQIEAEIGPVLGNTAVNRPHPAGEAEPGTLEHFLFERYLLYTAIRGKGLLMGQVHHRPYPIREANLKSCNDSLIAAAGIPITGPPCHTGYSDGVAVDIFPLQCVAAAN